MSTLYLASASPRRRELLAQIGVPFECVPADIDERVLSDESAEAYVSRLAAAKARAGFTRCATLAPNAVVLGADTAVVLAGRILGKPLDAADAIATLTALSGQVHQVLTAVAVFDGTREFVRVVSSNVHFRPLSAAECHAYWASGEPRDKAGSYGIQGLGAVFVRHLEGSYSAVVGLPLCETAALLAEFGIPCWQTAPQA